MNMHGRSGGTVRCLGKHYDDAVGADVGER